MFDRVLNTSLNYPVYFIQKYGNLAGQLYSRVKTGTSISLMLNQSYDSYFILFLILLPEFQPFYHNVLHFTDKPILSE